MSTNVPDDAEREQTDERWNDAIDWLLNSRYMDPEALVAFWGIADGKWTREDADAGFIDGKSLTQIAAESENQS